MLEEAVQKLEGWQSCFVRPAGFGITITESDRGFIVVKNSGVCQRDAIDVAREILQCLFAVADTFDVNDPVASPDLVRDCLESLWIGPFHACHKPRAEDT